MAATTFTPFFARVPVDEALYTFGLYSDERSQIKQYLNKYSTPISCGEYPSWMLFRVKEFVLNLLGCISKRFQSEEKKTERTIQQYLVQLADWRGSTDPMQRVIAKRSVQFAHLLLKQLRSSADKDIKSGAMTVKVNADYTYDRLLKVLEKDEETVKAGGTINFKSWPS